MQASVNSNGYRCAACGTMVWSGTFHWCDGSTGWLPATPTATYTVQRCPVCEGRGNVPADFYSRLGSGTSASPETCQTCDGRGILRVNVFGQVEKVT